MEQNLPQHLKTGQLGEKIACNYLVGKGYKVIERNYRKKCGEIDIVCSAPNLPAGNFIKNVLRGTFRKNTNLIFVEVKTLNKENWLNPEENFTYQKQKRLLRTCNLYLAEHDADLTKEWQIDVIAITINPGDRRAKLKHIKNVSILD